MVDKRIYARVVCDKLLKDNFVFVLLGKIVNFYCTIFTHHINTLKFDTKCPITKKEQSSNVFLRNVNENTTLLG